MHTGMPWTRIVLDYLLASKIHTAHGLLMYLHCGTHGVRNEVRSEFDRRGACMRKSAPPRSPLPSAHDADEDDEDEDDDIDEDDEDEAGKESKE